MAQELLNELEMLKNFISFYIAIFTCVHVAAATQSHIEAKEKLQYLLAVDRVEFYSENLADFLENKKSEELVSAIRDLTPEDFFDQNPTLDQLSQPQQWQTLIYNLVTKKHPEVSFSFSDLEWNYDFFKNKLASRFSIKGSKVLDLGYEVSSNKEIQSERSVPKIRGKKVLLDTDRYIAEKTSRAIFWDAILNEREFSFFVGSMTDFQEQIHKLKLEIVAEIKPLANNYNKIFIMYNPLSQKYMYGINLISGDDRIKHLSAQMRLISFRRKNVLDGNNKKIHIYGKAAEFHSRQEKILQDLFSRLPKADKVVIGQKGAIDEVILSAGILEVVSKTPSQVLAGLNLQKTANSKFEKLVANSEGISAFVKDATLPGAVLDKAYEMSKDPIQRAYKQFDSEQASHEFTDYLLIDKLGKIQRWRIFSAIWGDEIIPIAKALKNSGHKDVVYIGTAGAIVDKGLKVGDVISGDQVLTHSGKLLHFSPGNLVAPGQRPYVIGQVHTPFDETDKWLQTKAKNFDAVEVETGYLKEYLGDDAKLEAYFLISDVVGSTGETLANAAQNSSKRKRGQLRLLENLFIQNNIIAPISNYEILPANRLIRATIEKLKNLRPSREELSLLQVAQVALREGKANAEGLEFLLKTQPAFSRTEFNDVILSIGGLISEIQYRLGKSKSVSLVSESLFSGTFNPKIKTPLEIVVEGIHSEEEIVKKMGRENWIRFKTKLSKHFILNVGSETSAISIFGKKFHSSSPEEFYREYENIVLKPVGFISEVDMNGSFRTRSVPGIDRAIRCDTIFL